MFNDPDGQRDYWCVTDIMIGSKCSHTADEAMLVILGR